MKSAIIAAVQNKTAREKMARGIYVSLLGILTVACAACGGGGGGSSPAATSATTAPATAQKTVLIEAYGDSTQYGITYGSTGWVQNPYNAPYYLQVDLQAQLGSAVTVSNQGVSSTTGGMLLNGTDGAHQPWPAQMAQSKAQVVTINHAINDSGLGQESPADYKFVLQQLIGIARAAGKTVVLEEPAPVSYDANKAALLDQYIPIMEAVAQELNVPIVLNYDYIKSLPNWQAMEPDKIHPDADLYKIIADREAAVIGPIAKTMIAN